MSGPKYSRARLNMIRRQMLIEQAQKQLELEKQKRLKAEIQELNRQVGAFDCQSLREQCASHLQMLASVHADNFALLQYQTILNEVESICKVPFNSSADSTELSQSVKLANNILQKAKNLLQTASELDSKYESVFEQNKAHQKEQAFVHTDWTKVKVFNYCTIPNDLQEEYRKCLSVAMNTENASDHIAAIKRIYDSENMDNQYKLAELHMRRQSIVTAEQAEQHGDLAAKQAEYLSLCTLLGNGDAKLPTTSVELDDAVSSMKEQLEQKTMAEYISSALSDSLKELGYTVEGSETLIAKNRTIEKDSFNISTSSRLNVSSSTDGAVMFEVVGRPTENDKTAVRHDMERFCPDYQKVKAHLADKGVELTNEKLYPPSEEYVRFEQQTTTASNRRAGETATRKMYLNNG